MHYTKDQMMEYLALALPEDQEMAVEEHLAGCTPRTLLAREARDLTALLQQWTARSHGDAAQRAALAAALERAAATEPAWRDRLAAWRARWADRAEAAVRVVLAAPGTASRTLTDGLEALARPGAVWQPATMPAAGPVRGAATRRVSPSTAAVTLTAGTARARVAADGAAHEVVVRLDALPPDTPAPLLLLVPTAADTAPRVAAPERPPGADYLIARFADVPPGGYLVAFEPADAATSR